MESMGWLQFGAFFVTVLGLGLAGMAYLTRQFNRLGDCMTRLEDCMTRLEDRMTRLEDCMTRLERRGVMGKAPVDVEAVS